MRHKLRVAADGRLLIPAELRAQMDLDPEGHVSVWVDDGLLNVQSSAVGIRKARALVRKYITPGSDEVGDFLKERRAMWGEE